MISRELEVVLQLGSGDVRPNLLSKGRPSADGAGAHFLAKCRPSAVLATEAATKYPTYHVKRVKVRAGRVVQNARVRSILRNPGIHVCRDVNQWM